MGILNIPYNPQTDPRALFTQGAQNLLGGLTQGRQRRRLGEFAEGMDLEATAMQIVMSALSRGISPQIAMDLGGLQQKMQPKVSPVTPSPIMKMVNEDLLTFSEGKELARKEKEGDLGEKDIISIMHTIERALASTYTVLNEPISGEKYAERRNYYAQQLDIYRKRLDQLRTGKTEVGESGAIDFTGPGAGGVPGWDTESLGLEDTTPSPPGMTLQDAALEADKWLEPERIPKAKTQTFDKYPTPKTEKEFDNTIEHIRPEENKKLYFEMMLRRIEDDGLAARLYEKWKHLWPEEYE